MRYLVNDSFHTALNYSNHLLKSSLTLTESMRLLKIDLAYRTLIMYITSPTRSVLARALSSNHPQ